MGRTARLLIPLLALGIVGAPLGGFGGPLRASSTPGGGPTCPHDASVELLGTACRLPNGLWQARVPGGGELLTHGHDAPTHFFYTPPTWTPRTPVCVEDPSTEFHNLLIYARPQGRPDRVGMMAPEMRSMAAYANGLLRLEAEQLDRPLDYRFACDANGALAVATVALSKPYWEVEFANLVGDLQAAGFASTRAKYWIWVDFPFNAGGFGTIRSDDRAEPSNTNNLGPSYAATYGTRLAEGGHNVMMHESGHNLGAVQNSAPRSSGGWHCNDGADLMCYADGGVNSNYSETACPTWMPFDCGHDDYFHPNPPPGNWLATHWNLGSPANRYVRGCGYESGSIALGLNGTAIEGVSAQTIAVPPGCVGHRYAASAIIDGRAFVAGADVDVCWMNGEIVLGCHRAGVASMGAVPATATAAQVVLVSGARADFIVSII